MRIVKRMLLGWLVGAALAGGAMAGELVGNAPYAGGAFGQQSDQGVLQPYAQSFATPVGTVLEAIRWWGFHGQDSNGPAFDNFVVMLDGVAQTGALTVVPGASGFDEYTLDVPDAALTASVLSILNDSGDVEWYWQSAAAVGSPGAPDASGVAFSLIGHEGRLTVDEPAAPGLILAALAGLAWTRRHRRGAPWVRVTVKAVRCA